MQITLLNGQELANELEYWSIQELMRKYNELVAQENQIVYMGRASEDFAYGFGFMDESTKVFHNEDTAHGWLRNEITYTLFELMEDRVEDWANQRSVNWKEGTGL